MVGWPRIEVQMTFHAGSRPFLGQGKRLDELAIVILSGRIYRVFQDNDRFYFV